MRKLTIHYGEGNMMYKYTNIYVYIYIYIYALDEQTIYTSRRGVVNDKERNVHKRRDANCHSSESGLKE